MILTIPIITIQYNRMIPLTSEGETNITETYITRHVKSVSYNPKEIIVECVETQTQGKFNIVSGKFHNNDKIHNLLKETYYYLIEKDGDVNKFIENLFHIVYKNNAFFKVQCSINVDKFNDCKRKSIEQLAELSVKGVFNYNYVKMDSKLLSKKIMVLENMDYLNADMIKIIDHYSITIMEDKPYLFILYLTYLYRFELDRLLNNTTYEDPFEIECFNMFSCHNNSKIKDMFLKHDLFNIRLDIHLIG